MTNEEQKRIPFGNDKQVGGSGQERVGSYSDFLRRSTIWGWSSLAVRERVSASTASC